MDKIQILEKMIECLEKMKINNTILEVGLCSAYYNAKKRCIIHIEKTMLADIPELKAYQPKNYWNDLVYWFDPSDHDRRINICKEIIKKLKAETNGKN